MKFCVFSISTLFNFFFYSSVLGFFIQIPEIIWQSDHHLVRCNNGVSVTPHAGKIGFANKVILPVTKYEIITVNIINSIFIQHCCVTSLQLIQELALPTC